MTGAEASRAPVPPHNIIADFLTPDDHGRLLDWTVANEHLFVPSRTKGRDYDPVIRSCLSVRKDAGHWWVAAVREQVARLGEALFTAAGMKPFEIADVELELTAYNHGAHFLPHVDVVTGSERQQTDRVVSGVYYFFRNPKSFCGGALRLHRFGTTGSEEGDFFDIEPRQNRFLIFPSWARHEVRPVGCPSRQFVESRFAINCWIHRRREAGKRVRG